MHAQLLLDHAVSRGLINSHLEERTTSVKAVLSASGVLTLTAFSAKETVPASVGRGSAPEANFSCDMPQYIVGFHPVKPARGADCLRVFWEENLKVAQASKDLQLEAAIQAFLSDPSHAQRAERQFAALAQADAKLKYNSAWTVLYLDGDSHNVAHRPEVEAYLQSLFQGKMSPGSGSGFCCVTGIPTNPVKGTHVKVKGIPGTLGSGIPVFSWDKPAYQYADRKQSDNIFMSEQVAAGVKATIEYVLDKGEHHRFRSAITIGKDRTVAWFSSKLDLTSVTEVLDKFVYDEDRLKRAWDDIRALSSEDPVHVLSIHGASGRWGIVDGGSIPASAFANSLLQLEECFSWMRPVHAGRILSNVRTRTLGSPGHYPGMAPSPIAQLIMTVLLGKPVPTPMCERIVDMWAWGSKVDNPRTFLRNRASWVKLISLRKKEST